MVGREMKTKKKGLGCRAGWPSPEEAPAEDAGNLIEFRKGASCLVNDSISASGGPQTFL
jgi:hypothetical protein